MKKFLSILILLSIISLQHSAFSAPAIRLGEDGVFEIYDDKDLEPSVKEEIIIPDNNVVIQELQKKSEQEITSGKSAQDLEDEADYLRYIKSQEPENYISTKFETKEPSKIKKVAGKIAEGAVSGIVLIGVAAGVLFKSWLDSDNNEDDEKEEYCSKCKRYHKKHD